MFSWFRRPRPEPAAPLVGRMSYLSTEGGLDDDGSAMRREQVMAHVNARQFRVKPEGMKAWAAQGVAMDSNDWANGLKAQFRAGAGGMPEGQLLWYGSQGFIGYQLCAILAQQWLVSKACWMPARDAIRNGYDLTVGGEELPPDVMAYIRRRDHQYGLRRNCTEMIGMGRTFGIRHVLFKVKNPPPGYYENPFNPDAVQPGMYEGISQIDPYWLTPELQMRAAADPAAIDFYEPTWWQIQGQRIHKSHFVIFRGDPVADVLKPSYLYGGMSIPQKIYERVYAAERTANEAPLLALSKRSRVYKTALAAVMAKGEQHVLQKMEERARMLNNFGTELVDDKDSVEHHETTLTDLDVTIMTQYQLVAAIANVPATKLLGTTPKGFNSSGDYEQDSYHEELEGVQVDMEALIARHHLMLQRSELVEKFPDLAKAHIQVVWEPTDSPTAKEWAEINKAKADTDKALVESGAIDGQDVRDRLANDKNSGYQGLPEIVAPVVPVVPDDGQA